MRGSVNHVRAVAVGAAQPWLAGMPGLLQGVR
jgi:hypothetical protein